MKKLRRKGLADVESANAFLDAEDRADHNRRFAQAPASADDFHVAVPRGIRLDQQLVEETRTVSNDWVVRYDNRYLQIERQSQRPPARSTVTVYEAATGQLEIRYRDRVIRWTELAAPLPKLAAAPVAPGPSQPPTPKTRSQRRVQSADHPWHHGVEDYRASLHVAAARRAWLAVQP